MTFEFDYNLTYKNDSINGPFKQLYPMNNADTLIFIKLCAFSGIVLTPNKIATN